MTAKVGKSNRLFLLGGGDINPVRYDTTETRPRKLIMIDAFCYAGRALGMQVGAAIRKFYGWQSVFIVSFFFLVRVSMIRRLAYQTMVPL